LVGLHSQQCMKSTTTNLQLRVCVGPQLRRAYKTAEGKWLTKQDVAVKAKEEEAARVIQRCVAPMAPITHYAISPFNNKGTHLFLPCNTTHDHQSTT
jgi:hypothetical protein